MSTELPHGIPAGENDPGCPDGTQENVKAMDHLPAFPAPHTCYEHSVERRLRALEQPATRTLVCHDASPHRCSFQPAAPEPSADVALAEAWAERDRRVIAQLRASLLSAEAQLATVTDAKQRWIDRATRADDALMKAQQVGIDALALLDSVREVARGWSDGDCNVVQRYGDVILALLTAPSPGACTVPPAGWVCTRRSGHGGPCAASKAPSPGAGEKT